MKADGMCKKRRAILTLALSAVALTAVPYTVGATDAQKKVVANPAALPAVQSPAKMQTGTSSPGGRAPATPAGTATRPRTGGMDRARQASQTRDAQQQMRQLNDLRQGMQGADAMPGGQHRSGSGMPGVPGAGQPGGQLPGVSASGQDGGSHTGGSRRSGGAHTGGAPYLPGFEPRGGAHTGGGGAHTGGAARDPFVRDASGNPISQPAPRPMDDGKKEGDKPPAEKPKEEKRKEQKASYEKQDKPADKDTKEKETYGKEPAGKEPKEKTDKSTVMPRDDAGGGASPRMTNASQSSGPGARGGAGSGTARGPRVRANGMNVNPQLDAPRGGFVPRTRDQMGGAGPGTRPGQGAYGTEP